MERHFTSTVFLVDLLKKALKKSEFTQKRTQKRATSQKSELKKVYPLKKVNSRRAPKIE